jgi:hypothetical protein
MLLALAYRTSVAVAGADIAEAMHAPGRLAAAVKRMLS